jgi:hypothetical protein
MEPVAFGRSKSVDQTIPIHWIELDANAPETTLHRGLNGCGTIERVRVFANLSDDALYTSVRFRLVSCE